MKKIFYIIFVIMITISLASCTKNKPQDETQTQAPDKTQPAAAMSKTGKVIEKIDTAGYTYVQVDTGKEKMWIASTEFAVEVGETVSIPAQMMAMENYHSSTLDRTFELVYFTERIFKAGEEPPTPQMPPDHQDVDIAQGKNKAVAPTDMNFDNIKKPANGKTVAEVFKEKDSLSNSTVIIRAKVVKANNGILGVNWLHIQDGTGTAGSNDLTVTTQATANVGDIVLIEGKLTLNKDFGYGYKYDVMIENSKVTIENKQDL